MGRIQAELFKGRVGEIEEVHRFGDVQEGIGVVFQAKFLSLATKVSENVVVDEMTNLMVEIGFNEKVWT